MLENAKNTPLMKAKHVWNNLQVMEVAYLNRNPQEVLIFKVMKQVINRFEVNRSCEDVRSKNDAIAP